MATNRSKRRKLLSQMKFAKVAILSTYLPSHMRFILALVLLSIYLRGFASLLEEVVVTATRSDQQVQTLTSNIATVDEINLERVNHIHLNEVMQRVAGVWISRGNGQESLTAIRSPVLTGAGGCGAFLMAQDGIPLQASGFCNVNELFGAQSETASRIEVIRGPGSVLHGSNAMHGLINIITPPVSDRPIFPWSAGIRSP